MDEATRTGSQAVEESAPERSPEEIRRDIEQTRQQLGDTAAAVARKADVKAQARAKVEQAKVKASARKEETKRKASARKEELVGKARSASPDSATTVARRAADTAKRRPLPFAVAGALAVGFVVGRRSAA